MGLDMSHTDTTPALTVHRYKGTRDRFRPDAPFTPMKLGRTCWMPRTPEAIGLGDIVRVTGCGSYPLYGRVRRVEGDSLFLTLADPQPLGSHWFDRDQLELV